MFKSNNTDKTDYSPLIREDADNDLLCFGGDGTSLQMATLLSGEDPNRHVTVMSVGSTCEREQVNDEDDCEGQYNIDDTQATSSRKGAVYCSSTLLCYALSVLMTASFTSIVCILLFGNANTATEIKYVVSGYQPSAVPIASGSLSNLIVGITDGMGPSYATLARILKQYDNKEDVHNTYTNTSLSFDCDLIGQQRTRSYDSYITDSAAAASALASGHRTNNHWIGVLPNLTNVAPVFSAIKNQKNMHIGLVVKSSVTHATPAGFYAHTIDRGNEYLIADQALDFEPDVLLGGGRDYFENRPVAYYSSTKAIHNRSSLIPDFEGKGYIIVYNKKDLLASDPNAGKRVLGLFAGGAMKFSIDGDRESAAPDLLIMVQCAVDALEAMSKASGKPYALMLEASLIDWAGHINDGATIAREVLEWEKVWSYLKQRVWDQDRVQKQDARAETVTNTQTGTPSTSPFSLRLLATSDHETGGLTIGANGLETFDVAALANQKSSFSTVYSQLAAHRWSEYPQSRKEAMAYVTGLASEALGIPVSQFTEEDLECLYSPLPPISPDHAPSPGQRSFSIDLDCIQNARVHTAYTTNGHTGADVNVYAYPPLDPIFNSLRGVVDNFDIAWWMASQWDVDMSSERERVALIPNGSG
ncbi:hypothetical protein SARC_04769 [Sphaeroforma arctica JP610]|uniref:alkaline phosphatase n=1 Tax=Sphaeroforma arctica JP610 TaxID=667725 RepID=A0A0L0G1B7_9EUKA|nr:hypothetical protein SARC_04769 [Sphaeroforma arctica JP610]KNC82947.1 hypothetical protein SARC_04769 [Sphaeroforma arctica JP610]|eukprot:XP_014156849.1 hypothetical protein SARC_04769 [Sphaeroforma arctica JP610]